MTTKTIATWATGLGPHAIPQTVRQAASRSLYNYIGCAVGGCNHLTVSKVKDSLSDFFGKPTSTVFGNRESLRTDSQHAALLNGIASHVHDYDDTHLSTIIHPTGPVASAALAYAERCESPITGSDLITALIIGIETSCKLGLAVWPSHYDIGWHITSSTGSIGAAVAVAKLMELTENQTAHAIGIAATQVTGLREMFGSDTKAFHVGRAAQNGLLAAQLASKGFTSSESALEANRGWANVVIGSSEHKPQLDRFCTLESPDGLGQTWEIEKNAFKPFPCGIVCHPAIDAAIQLHHDFQARNVNIEDIQSVDIKVHPLVLELTSKRTPKDGLEGKFSVFHGAAVGLLFGKAGPAQYDDALVTSAQVITLRDRVNARIGEDIKPDEAYMTVRLRNGKILDKHVEHAVGSLEKPMTDSDLSDKFLDQCGLVLRREAAGEASALAWGLGEADDVGEILRRL
ncbi:Putative MmgE/PrpD superfamily protein [Septoria linicola]|uniref:MmgE/PrpD superfamily protein n=1 Tax=Septoria linicola TaxID=215465 RepID=A0A9Q9B0S1_9PEZI|nr:Putative MmgE/PrpD superfamily protein [Septoria linicola]